MSRDVVVVGSANLDLVVGVARPPQVGETLLGDALGRHAGGKGLNQAIAAARAGASTRFSAMVGADDAGVFLQQTLETAGVVGTMLTTADAPTGVAHIFSYPDGDNSIVVAAGANSHLTGDHVEAAVAGAAVVLAQLEVPLETVASALAAAAEADAFSIVNAAPANREALTLLSLADAVIVNETECEEFGGVDALQHLGVEMVVVTRGGDGVDGYRVGADPIHIDAFAITPVDTTGAGDAFCGAFAAAIATGADFEAALRRGSAAGAIVAQHSGANTPALTPAAIDALVA